MNQKQRDYLIKRLQKLAEEKKSAFKVEEPDANPFIKQLKMKNHNELVNLLTSKIKVSERKNYNYNIKDYDRVYDLNDNYSSIYASNIYSNYSEVSEAFQAFCKKHYKVYNDRLASIDKECQNHCDKIVFAESYDEALKIIQEFTKF